MMHDEVVSRLRHILTEGEIAPGARIPERDLCVSLGISRTPLREALKVLAAEGLVVLLPNRGSRAAKLTQKDVNELFEVCEALEATAGELACPRISDEQLRVIAELQTEMVAHYRTRDLLSYYRCNRQIHEAIVKAADNAVLASFYESVAARIRRARFITPMSAEHWALAVQEHEAILNALQRRDGSGLAHILRTHLRRKRDEVVLAGFAERDDDQPRDADEPEVERGSGSARRKKAPPFEAGPSVQNEIVGKQEGRSPPDGRELRARIKPS